MLEKKKLYNHAVAQHECHPFHIVDPSPWPILTAMSLWSTALGFILYFHYFNYGWLHLLVGMLFVCMCLTAWFVDIVREATFQGFHTFKVQQNIYLGMLLFIISEIMFFFSFFWAFFHFSLSPSIWIGGIWPPKGIIATSPWGLPLINTVVLLNSGLYITIAHQELKLGAHVAASDAMIVTQLNACIFLGVQLYEYQTAPFSINDSVYGSIFYMTTGFHGIHVLVGTIFIFVCWVRYWCGHFSRKHHVGLVCAIWYWHFVDVVWIFLYLCVYIWGGSNPPHPFFL